MLQPPKTPLKILKWFCDEQRLEEIEGDLFEAYQDWRSNMGKFSSNLLYYFTIFKSAFYIHKKRKETVFFRFLIWHYTKTAARDLVKNRTTSTINIFGLSLGIASCLLLGIYLFEQNRIDDFFEDKNQVYRLEGVNTDIKTNGNSWQIHPGIPQVLKGQIPEVIDYCRVEGYEIEFLVMSEKSREFINEKTIIADFNFFSFFPFEILEGNEDALSNKKSLVISERLATKLGGIEESIGKKLTTVYNSSTYTVAAVMKNPPPNSSAQFDIVRPIDFPYGINSKGYSPAVVFLKTTKDVDLKALEEKIQPTILANSDNNLLEEKNYELFEWKELRFRKEVLDGFVTVTDKSVLKLFSIIGVVILLLAISNYINLTATKSVQKGTETGMRKILGAGRMSFLLQYSAQSFISCLLAFPIALLLLRFSQPYFEEVIGRKLFYTFWTDPIFYIIVLVILLVIGIVSSVYPSILVSGFKNSDFLKGRASSTKKGNHLKNGLIIFQFCITIILVICALTVKSQLRFIQNQSLSFKPNQVVIIDYTIDTKLSVLKELWGSIPYIENISFTTSPPAGDNRHLTATSETIDFPVPVHKVDENYFKLLGLKIKSGQDFNPKLSTDENQGVIINEAMARYLTTRNYFNVEFPLRQKYDFHMHIMSNIRGVVEDFPLEPMHAEIKPMVFIYDSFEGYNGARIMVKINNHNTSKALKELESTWYDVYPNKQFDAKFLSTRFEQLYAEETRLARAYNILTVIALIISLMGLFGLVGFMVNARTKEIGVRKVMGAKVTQIIQIFIGQIFKLVGIGCLIAIPIAFYLGRTWLNNYAYRTEIPYGLILLAILIIFSFSGILIFLRSRNTANLNPVHTLRNE